jgi:hypothetical protein
MVTPSNGSRGVASLRDQPSCHPNPPLDKMVSTGGPHGRGAHDRWLVKRLNPVPFADLRLGMLMVSFIVFCIFAFPRSSWEWDRSGLTTSLVLFLVPEVFVAGLCSCLFSVFSPPPPVLNNTSK